MPPAEVKVRIERLFCERAEMLTAVTYVFYHGQLSGCARVSC